MNSIQYDIIIIGGGPSGSTAALYASRAGLKTLLVDKARFPRDKICGDALSGKSVGILGELGLLDKVRQLPGAAITRIIFTSPNHTALEIDLANSDLNQILEGFVIRREVFDEFMLNEVRQTKDIEIREGFEVTDLLWDNGQVAGVRGHAEGQTAESELPAGVVLGADGFNSLVARKTGLYRHTPKHHVVALRQYFEGVGDLTDQIELHFIDEVIPGYFWIFPVEDGRANIGIGMLHSYIKSEKVDLKKALGNVITSETFRARFGGARPLEEPQGWNLPVGSLHRPCYGDGFLLLGDAAGLIDPFTGEGIGNALYSGKFAIQAITEAQAKDHFKRSSLKRYDELLWKEVGPELKVSAILQKIGRSHRMLNFVIGKASRNRELGNLIAGMIANEAPRASLTNPLFYLRILFS